MLKRTEQLYRHFHEKTYLRKLAFKNITSFHKREVVCWRYKCSFGYKRYPDKKYFYLMCISSIWLLSNFSNIQVLNVIFQIARNLILSQIPNKSWRHMEDVSYISFDIMYFIIPHQTYSHYSNNITEMILEVQDN